MKCNSRDWWAGMVDISEGKTNEETAKHIEKCPECRVKFDQLTKMIQTMSIEHFVAPTLDVDRAKSLMPESIRHLSLLRTSINLSGARSANQDFQAVYSGEGIELRVMYLKTDSGWNVMSRLPEPAWHVSRLGQVLATDPEGRFEFATDTLDDSQFQLRASEVKLVVPSFGESIDGSDRDS